MFIVQGMVMCVNAQLVVCYVGYVVKGILSQPSLNQPSKFLMCIFKGLLIRGGDYYYY